PHIGQELFPARPERCAPTALVGERFVTSDLGKSIELGIELLPQCTDTSIANLIGTCCGSHHTSPPRQDGFRCGRVRKLCGAVHTVHVVFGTSSGVGCGRVPRPGNPGAAPCRKYTFGTRFKILTFDGQFCFAPITTNKSMLWKSHLGSQRPPAKPE